MNTPVRGVLPPPRKSGNVHQLAAARYVSAQALDEAKLAARNVRVLQMHIVLLWIGIAALAIKECL